MACGSNWKDEVVSGDLLTSVMIDSSKRRPLPSESPISRSPVRYVFSTFSTPNKQPHWHEPMNVLSFSSHVVAENKRDGNNTVFGRL